MLKSFRLFASDQVVLEAERDATGPRVKQSQPCDLDHRGQLSVYLRLLDIAVPVINGRSADETPFT